MAPRHIITESRCGRDWQSDVGIPERAGRDASPRADAQDPTPTPLGAALHILESILVDGRGAGAACDVLLQATGSSECLVALWQGDGQPTILASRGDVSLGSRELFSFFAPIDRAGRSAASLRDGYGGRDSEYWCCGYRAPGTELAGCVVRERPVGPLLAALCRVLVLSVASEETRRDATYPSRLRPAEPAARLPASSAPGFAPAVSPGMLRVYSLVELARKGSFPVLVVGETGAGKEHVVRLLHESSARSAAPFVAVNCAAIPAELLEAELFGVARGAATGVQERSGRVQQAEGGTLFLDEIGEMPLSLQPKLLRMLDSGEVCPVGGTPFRVETRFVAATNLDLDARIRAGAFRADLYYRLAGFQIDVPPLRERREDVPVLLEHFLERFSSESGRRVRGFTLKALGALRAYDWPGNVRELEGEVRRLVYVCPEGVPIEWGMLAARVRARTDAAREPAPLDLAAQVRSLEERLIRAALEHSRGHRGEAARMLGISRNWLAIKLRRLERAERSAGA